MCEKQERQGLELWLEKKIKCNTKVANILLYVHIHVCLRPLFSEDFSEKDIPPLCSGDFPEMDIQPLCLIKYEMNTLFFRT